MRLASTAIALGLGLAFAGPLHAQRLSYDNADADNDDRVSRAEFVAARDRQFARFDKNGDGAISSTDFAHAASYRRGLRKIDRALAVLDLNGDGSLSREEVHESGTPIFDRADADHDGYLTETELESVREALAERRRAIS